MAASDSRLLVIAISLLLAFACGEGHYETVDGEEILPQRSADLTSGEEEEEDEEEEDEEEGEAEDLGLAEFKKQLGGINSACVSCHNTGASAASTIEFAKDNYESQRNALVEFLAGCPSQQILDALNAASHPGKSAVSAAKITKQKLDAWAKADESCK